jgi:hypothetical protein
MESVPLGNPEKCRQEFEKQSASRRIEYLLGSKITVGVSHPARNLGAAAIWQYPGPGKTNECKGWIEVLSPFPGKSSGFDEMPGDEDLFEWGMGALATKGT